MDRISFLSVSLSYLENFAVWVTEKTLIDVVVKNLSLNVSKWHKALLMKSIFLKF